MKLSVDAGIIRPADKIIQRDIKIIRNLDEGVIVRLADAVFKSADGVLRQT